MNHLAYKFDVVDFAYQIIEMHEKILSLQSELNHYKKLHQQSRDFIRQSGENTKEMTGIILEAVLDPNSIINKGNEAIIKEKMKAE